MAKLVVLAAVAMLFSPAICNAFGGKAGGEGKSYNAGHQMRIPPFMAQKYDTDADGKLSDIERKAARAAIIEKYDVDGDGELSRKERRAVRDAAHDAFIERYDADGDGEVSEQEHDAAKADFIDRHDKDGDGALSKDELPWGRDGKRGGPGRRGKPRR